MGWGIIGDVAKGVSNAVDKAQDTVSDAAKGAFDAAVDVAEDAVDTAKRVGNVVSNASLSDIGHTALDVAGMVPVIGEAADLTNAAWYAAEGDYKNAALSAASAIPLAGNVATAAKWGKKAVDVADTVGDIAKVTDKAGDVARAADKTGDAAKAVDKADAANDVNRARKVDGKKVDNDDLQGTKKPSSKLDEQKKAVSEPVDVVTGEYLDMHTDISFPITLRRIYQSGLKHHGALGKGWVDSWSAWLEVRESDNEIDYYSETGQVIVFPLPSRIGQASRNLHVPKLALYRTEQGYAIDTGRRELWHFMRYGDKHQLTVIINPDRQGVEFERNLQGALTGVIASNGDHYTVDSSHGRIDAVHWQKPDGKTRILVRYRYNDLGQLVEFESASGGHYRYEYDGDDRMVYWSDANGEAWTRMRYDESGRCVAVDSVEDYYQDRFHYDADGRATTYFDAAGGRSIYRYDKNGFVTEITDPLGRRTRQQWGQWGELLCRTDASGAATTFRYDARGNLIQANDAAGHSQRWSYNDFNQISAYTDPQGQTWRAEYDERGHRIESAAPDGDRHLFAYDGQGRMTAVGDAQGRKRRFVYNSHGLLHSASDWSGQNTTFLYNAEGQVSHQIDALGGVSRYRYTAEGYLQEAEQQNGVTERYRYNDKGQVLEAIDANNKSARYAYTAFHRLSETTDAKGGTLRFAYGPGMRLQQVINAQGETWSYQYDAAGQLVRETDFGNRNIEYDYDARGLCTARRQGDGIVQFAYDALGRLTKKITADGETCFSYDPLGRLLAATSADATISYRYDARGRVLEERQNDRSVVSHYQHGLRAERQTPSSATRYDYDANGRLIALAADDTHELSLTRDAVGRDVRRKGDAGFIQQQVFDPTGLLLQQMAGAEKAGPGAPVVDRRYDYDRVANPRQIEDLHWGTTAYQYDDNQQIVSATSAANTERFVYDAAQRLTGHSKAAGTAVKTWQLEQGAVSAARGTGFHYDAAGRVVKKTVERDGFRPQTWQYGWNSENQLIELKTPDNATWRYRYDPLGRRIEKHNGRHGEQYLWDGDLLAEVIPLDAAHQPDSKQAPTVWHFEPGGHRPIAKQQAGHIWYVVTDHLGTPRELFTADGEIAWRARLSVWGNVKQQQQLNGTSTDCPIRFQGQYYDDESGLHYNRFRYYDSEVGQYLSPDPLGLSGGTRPHGYVHNPNGWIDPLGLTECRVGDDVPVHRIGGKEVENLKLKKAEETLDPPGFSVLRGGSADDAADAMRQAFPNATGLHKASEVTGTSTAGKIREAGFDVMPDPTKKFPNHGRLVHPDGTTGFTGENLKRLSNAFTDTPTPPL